MRDALILEYSKILLYSKKMNGQKRMKKKILSLVMLLYSAQHTYTAVFNYNNIQFDSESDEFLHAFFYFLVYTVRFAL